MPANSAYSFLITDNSFKDMRLLGGTDFREEALLRLISSDNSPLTISILRVPKNDPYVPGGLYDMTPNNFDHYQSNSIYNSEYIFDKNYLLDSDGQTTSRYFVTIINPHNEAINVEELVFEIRDAKYFRDNEKEVVKSRGDGLMWQDNAETSSIFVSSIGDALTYCNKTLNGIDSIDYPSGFAGYTDWRNPSMNDFFTFLDYSDNIDENGEPYIIFFTESATANPNAQRPFVNIKDGVSDYYWTDENPLIGGSNSKIRGSLIRSLNESSGGILGNYMRCVRDIN